LDSQGENAESTSASLPIVNGSSGTKKIDDSLVDNLSGNISNFIFKFENFFLLSIVVLYFLEITDSAFDLLREMPTLLKAWLEPVECDKAIKHSSFSFHEKVNDFETFRSRVEELYDDLYFFLFYLLLISIFQIISF